MKPFPRRALCMVFAIVFCVILSACGGSASLTVNTADDVDDGVCNTTHCSLREAIQKANTLAGTITIKFDIGGGGGQTIRPKSPLPAVTVPVTIDGTTQPGYTFDPLIELDGSLAAGGYADGLILNGGMSTVRRLVINNFNGNGIRLDGGGENFILGCYIGTDAAGTAARPNMGGGIRIVEGQKNVIGGTAASERNLISGNHSDGIQILDIKNSVIGNYIGVDVTGTAVLPNIGAGVMIEAGLTIVGGSSAGQGNVISGNESVGISFQTGATDGFVMGNLIGTDLTGKIPLGNKSWGVILHDNHNTVGGDTPGKRNVISANGKEGVYINASSEDNFVQGNYIGTDITGKQPMGNQMGGVFIAGNGNTIGGKLGLTGNVISANLGEGVKVNGVRNAVQGNLIGVNALGTTALGNQGSGVVLNGNLGLAGGTDSGNGNIISANEGDGVRVTSGATLVQGNYVGTDITGTADLGNQANGVYVFAAGSIQIGGSDPGARNVISGNQLVGVFIEDGSDDVSVYGNYIGTDAAGMAPIKNIKAGIAAYGTNIQIGAAFEGGRNIISGNGGPGIAVVSTASDVKIQNNYIGTDAAGMGPLGNSNGIEAPNTLGAPGLLIGGDPYSEGNLISGNDEIGVQIGNDVTVQGNKIGTDDSGSGPLGNGTDGIKVDGYGNIIGGTGFFNTIAFNGGHGVAVISGSGSAIDNSILSNSIHDNDMLGIALDEDVVIPNDNMDPDTGDNNRQNYPVITSAIADAVAMESTISGTLNSLPGTVFTIQIFTNASCDPSGYGEGHRLIRTMTVTTNISGHAVFNALFAATYIDPANFVTATATDPAGNTSGFSNCLQVVDAGSVTPTPAAMTFKPFFDPAEIFYGTRCTPDKVRLSVEIGNPPEPISYVLLFVRLMDKVTGEKTAWGGGLTMLGAGKNTFYYDLMSYDVPEYSAFESAWLQYQFVVYNKAEEKIGYSEVYGDVAFTRCGPNRPAGAK
ncbi:MAG: CSLREA domain-containing protein [Anaerolineales bacterium]|nr:CSLREA domain-containing protein [Anaerolineales bacterium]